MPLAITEPRHPANDPLYADIDASRLPSVENMVDTRIRVMEFWVQAIVPQIRQRKRLPISAHGNTLRALIMHLDGMTVTEVEDFEIPTATPIIYHFNMEGHALQWRYLESNCREEVSA